MNIFLIWIDILRIMFSIDIMYFDICIICIFQYVMISEVEFVTAVTAGGSVKFLPAV